MSVEDAVKFLLRCRYDQSFLAKFVALWTEAIDKGRSLELGAAQAFFDSHDEDLIKGLDRQPMPLFLGSITNHWADLLGRAVGRYSILPQVPAIWHNYSLRRSI